MASDEHSWDRACTHSRGCWGEGGGEWRSRARSIQQHQRVAAPLAQLQQQVAAQPLVACFVASHVISKVRTKALSRLLASIDEQELEGALPVHLSWHAPEPGARRQVEAITAGRPWMRRCLEQHSPHSQFEHLEALVKDALNGPVPPPYWVFFSVRAAPAAPIFSCYSPVANRSTLPVRNSRACARAPIIRTTTTYGPLVGAASSRSDARRRRGPT